MFGTIDRFFDGPIYHRDPLQNNSRQIIDWWEGRRCFYNKLLAAIGTLTCVLMISCGVIAEPLTGEPIAIPDPPIVMPLGIIAYAIVANICYTAGWITELLLARFKAPTAAFGVRAFRMGIKFSVGLTLFPAVLSWAGLTLALGTR